MRERRQATAPHHRARGFAEFAGGAAGRLLHAATLLTAEPPARNPRAQELLTAALAATYARWDRLRDDDPYDRARQELVARFARAAWRFHRPAAGGLLSRLTPQERLVLVLRLYEGVAEEQAAALLGLPVERVRAVCTRAVAALRHGAATPVAPPGAPDRAVTP
ncbi:sigma factor-like helix-turn-helix DNA-binding protein [Streptomyces sp. NPDC051310]|uniref:sigma factor-like helix-turn-helix DNA-binding protein n=1 Tax=Streptomyces sp. NPDC051310 TaxID=3365649 RepID=UPI0037B16BF9